MGEKNHSPKLKEEFFNLLKIQKKKIDWLNNKNLLNLGKKEWKKKYKIEKYLKI